MGEVIRYVILDETVQSATDYGHCFPGGTSILLSDGTSKNFEDIVIGDSVSSFDIGENRGRGKLVAQKVVRLFSNEVDELIELNFNGALPK